MRIARLYTFELEFIERAELPKWKGNMIRGAIGLHLRSKSCLTDGDCLKCSLLFKCPYGYLFEAKSKGIVLRKLEGYAKPYTIKPPLTEKTEFEEGDDLNFSVVLFGDAVRFERFLLASVAEMARRGLGRRGSVGKLKLKNAYVENPFAREKSILYDGREVYDPKTWITTRDISGSIGRTFLLRFLTPFRLLKEGKLLRDFDFSELAPFILRKYSAIMQQYVGSVDVDARRALVNSTGVKLLGERMSEVNFKYKGEDQEFLIGELVYSGRLLADVRKPLAFCQLSHIGKRSSFGFGWYELLSI